MPQPKHVLEGKNYETEYNLINENIRELSDQLTLENFGGNRILIKDDTNTPRILIGYQENGF